MQLLQLDASTSSGKSKKSSHASQEPANEPPSASSRTNTVLLAASDEGTNSEDNPEEMDSDQLSCTCQFYKKGPVSLLQERSEEKVVEEPKEEAAEPDKSSQATGFLAAEGPLPVGGGGRASFLEQRGSVDSN